MGGKVAKPDLRIAEMASKQYGVVSIDQLRRLGLSEKAIARRVDGGLLHRVHRGVYAAGHFALAPEGRWLAAVLALGGGPRGGGSVLEHWGAAVSHRSALSLWSLLPVNQSPVTSSLPATEAGPGAEGSAFTARSLSRPVT